MKHTFYRNFFIMSLCGAFLVGCSSNSETETTTDQSAETQTDSSQDGTDTPSASKEEGNSKNEESSDPSSHPEEADKDAIALENLELPEIYENTVIYNGSINPETSLRIIFPEEDRPYPDILGSDLTDSGAFAMMPRQQQELQEGDQITFFISGGGLGTEQDFYRTVQPSEEGKEIVVSELDTEEQGQQLLEEEVSLPNIYSNTRIFDGEVSSNVEGLYYRDASGELSSDLVMNFAEDDADSPKRLLSIFDENFQTGQNIEFYMIADGLTIPFEKEVQPLSEEEQQAVNKIESTTILLELSTTTENYEGETIPNAEIKVLNPELASRIINRTSDEQGIFSLTFDESNNMLVEDGSLLFEITDENGNTATLEKEVTE